MKQWLKMIAYVTRCRQSCCHGSLVPAEALEAAEEVLQQLEGSDLTDKDLAFALDTEEGKALLTRIMLTLVRSTDDGAEEYDSTCAVCFDELEEDNARVLRSCKHVFCGDCLEEIKNKGGGTCPMCRKRFSRADIISKAVAEAAAKKAAAKDADKKKKASQIKKSDNKKMHPKEVAVLDELANLQKDEKVVIFSEWTSVLDIMQRTLEKNGYKTSRIDGTMNTDQRVDAIEAFQSDDAGSPRVIMCSMMACGVYWIFHCYLVLFLLTNASHFHPCRYGYNPNPRECGHYHGTVLELGRRGPGLVPDPSHRPDAQRSYRSSHHEGKCTLRFFSCNLREISCNLKRSIFLVPQDSLEERMLEKVQDGKSFLGKGSIGKLKKEDREKARLTAMKDLFELDRSVNQWEGHYEDSSDEDDADDHGNLAGFVVDDEEDEFD